MDPSICFWSLKYISYKYDDIMCCYQTGWLVHDDDDQEHIDYDDYDWDDDDDDIVGWQQSGWLVSGQVLR